MDMVHPGQAASRNRDTRETAGHMLLWTIILSIGLAVAFIAYSYFGGGDEHARAAGSAAVDPLTQPAAIEFRRSEHETAGSVAFDPLTQPAAIEFRRSEHDESR
jgi:hypothetical protein